LALAIGHAGPMFRLALLVLFASLVITLAPVPA
jgi:hypothetical protein